MRPRRNQKRGDGASEDAPSPLLLHTRARRDELAVADRPLFDDLMGVAERVMQLRRPARARSLLPLLEDPTVKRLAGQYVRMAATARAPSRALPAPVPVEGDPPVVGSGFLLVYLLHVFWAMTDRPLAEPRADDRRIAAELFASGRFACLESLAREGVLEYDVPEDPLRSDAAYAVRFEPDVPDSEIARIAALLRPPWWRR